MAGSSDQTIGEIKKIVESIVQIRTDLTTRSLVDCNRILSYLGHKTIANNHSIIDSGFETELSSEILNTCMISSARILHKFESNDLDTLLEQILKYLCHYIYDHLDDDREEITTNSELIDTFLSCIRYFENTENVSSYRKILQLFLENLLAKTVPFHENDDQFNFVMELCRRFGFITGTYEIVSNLLENYLLKFVQNLRHSKKTYISLLKYEEDIAKSTTILTVLNMIKRTGVIQTDQDTERQFEIAKGMAELEDHFQLGYLSYKCFLT